MRDMTRAMPMEKCLPLASTTSGLRSIAWTMKAKAKALLAVCAVPLLTAATVQQWRQREPRWIGYSDKPLDQLIGCLGSNYAASLSAKMVAMPIERGMSYTNAGSNRDILVDVVDEGNRRTVKLWLRSYFGITAGAKEQIEKLSACTNP